jgi:nucleotide-binding universal stress UspA family protein
MPRILVAVDGSEPSQRAASRAAHLALKLGHSLTLVHVLPLPPLMTEPALLINVAKLEEEQYERGRRLLARLQESLVQPQPGLQIDLQLQTGAPAETLATLAEAADVDFVAVGSRGHALVASMLLGSVSHRLIHICKKPVLIVH